MVRAMRFQIAANGDFVASKEEQDLQEGAQILKFMAWGQGSTLHLLTYDFRQVTYLSKPQLFPPPPPWGYNKIICLIYLIGLFI